MIRAAAVAFLGRMKNREAVSASGARLYLDAVDDSGCAAAALAFVDLVLAISIPVAAFYTVVECLWRSESLWSTS